MKQSTVIIVGAGPVGMITALGLAQAGLDVTLIESHADIIPEPRAMTYHWAVHEGMQKLGLLDEMIEEGFKLHEMCYRILATGEIIRLGIDAISDLTPYPYAVVLGQDQLEGIVLRRLEAMPNVRIHWCTTVRDLRQDDAGVEVITEQNGHDVTFRADWLVGTDGGRSTVRKLVGATFEGMTWPQRFIATNVQCDLEAWGWDPCNYLVDPNDGAVIAKVTRSGIWRVTFSEDVSLPLESVEDRIQAFYDRVLPEGMPYTKLLHSAYNMHQRWTDRMRIGRVLLAGDAAHVTNPTNGFGLVSGMLDAQVLIEALAAVAVGRASESVLDRYSEERLRVFAEIASPSSVETKRLVFHSDDPVRLEEDLVRLRAMADDRALLRERFQIGARLRTPSVLG